MAEPIVEQIAVKLQALFAAIVADAGTTYWYTPGAVIRCDYFEDAPPAAAHQVIYQLRPGDRTRHARATRSTWDRSADWYLTVAARDLRPSTDPYRGSSPIPELVKSRLLADVQRSLSSQPWTTWAGLNVRSVTLTAEDLAGAEVEWEGWCVANAQISVEWVER